jgi:rubrerythrin
MTDLVPLARAEHRHEWVYTWHDPDAVSEWTCETCGGTWDGNLPDDGTAND